MDNRPKLQEKKMIQFSKSNMAAVCYGPNFLLKYLIVDVFRCKQLFYYSSVMMDNKRTFFPAFGIYSPFFQYVNIKIYVFVYYILYFCKL